MSLHIGAKPDEIAETVLISGDPLRARNIAETMLSEVICYNQVRGMLGFTGLYNGKRVSVQGTGMGIPSTAIYVHELIQEYGVNKIMRIGTCGAIQPSLGLNQLILAEAAFTDSSTNLLFNKSKELLESAIGTAKLYHIPAVAGRIFTTDSFYHDDEKRWDKYIAQGVLAVEMETSIIYNLAAKYNIQALSILSVSDNIVTQAFTTASEREHASQDMMKLALELA